MGWRGYVSEYNAGAWARFPYFVSLLGQQDLSGPMIPGGLSAARIGDILIWDEDVVGGDRLPHVALVVGLGNREPTGLHSGGYMTNKVFFPKQADEILIPSINIIEFNYGKYPDTCGNTNWWGNGSVERKLYRGTLPSKYAEQMTDAGIDDPTCSNPDLRHCVEELWDQVKIYRPSEHNRN